MSSNCCQQAVDVGLAWGLLGSEAIPPNAVQYSTSHSRQIHLPGLPPAQLSPVAPPTCRVQSNFHLGLSLMDLKVHLPSIT
jgi:hypothetical protein